MNEPKFKLSRSPFFPYLWAAFFEKDPEGWDDMSRFMSPDEAREAALAIGGVEEDQS